jgi:hypothetical protein
MAIGQFPVLDRHEDGNRPRLAVDCPWDHRLYADVKTSSRDAARSSDLESTGMARK